MKSRFLISLLIFPFMVEAQFGVTPKLIRESTRSWTEIDARDLDNDGDRELIQWIGGAVVFENLGPEKFDSVGVAIGAGSVHFFGDLNNDGLEDVAYYQRDSIVWRENLGNITFSERRTVGGFVPQAEDVNGADLDNDGDIDLFAANGTIALPRWSNAWWYENDGTGNFTPHKLADTVYSIIRMDPIDIDLDGDLDLMMFGHDNEVDVFENLGNGNFGPRTVSTSTGLDSPDDIKRREIVDLDNDGDLDIVMSDFGWGLRSCFWYENNGDGTFRDAIILIGTGANSGGSYHITFFTLDDYDMDGDLDVFMSGNRKNQFVYRENLGGGQFRGFKAIYGTGGFTIDLDESTLCDVDHDGDLDPVWVESNGDNSRHWLYWLSDELPPPNGFDVLNSNFSCDENETPDDATDDILFVTLNLSGNNLSDSFLVSTQIGEVIPKIAPYDEDVLFEFSPGSASGLPTTIFYVKDQNDWTNNTGILLPEPVDSCSLEATPAPGFREISTLQCHSNLTPSDPTDDKIVFSYLVEPYDLPPSDSFVMRTNFGPVRWFATDTISLYGRNYRVTLPEGSAGDEPLEILLRDKANPQYSRTYVFDNPGTCSDVVSTVNYEEGSLLTAYPNPFREKVTFELKNPSDCKNCRLEIYNALGQPNGVFLPENQIHFKPEETDRVYFFYLKNEFGAIMETGKLIRLD